MKLEKDVVERRLQLMRDEGVEFVVNADVGRDIDVINLIDDNDALLLATGATMQEIYLSCREAKGVHMAMEFLTANTKSLLDSNEDGTTFRPKAKTSL